MVSGGRYQAFGHVLQSQFPIDILPVAAEKTAATITVKLTRGLIRPEIEEPVFFDIQPERQFFQWTSVGAFFIEAPDTILVEPNPDTPWRLVSQPLLGIVISVTLERLGAFCLHGGAVDVDGTAAIVLGDKGAGKSTTVSALLHAGRKLLTDDLVALTFSEPDAHPLVQSGFPSIKLWPDSDAALSLESAEGSELIHPSITKVQKAITSDMMAAPVPTGGIFILVPNQEGRTEAVKMDPPAALQALLYFAFISRFGNTALGPAHLSVFMKHCAQVVKTTPVYTLHVGRDFARLDDLAATIADATKAQDSQAYEATR